MDMNNLSLTPAPESAYGHPIVAHAEEESTALSELFNIYVETEPRLVPGYCSLPTETLEAIFILYARHYFHSESHGDGRSDSRGDPTPAPPYWVNVSYVCRQWRDVALNCAPLWTYLFNASPRWTEELLVRSKQASLKLRVNLPCGNKENRKHRSARFFEQVVCHSERIQDFRLYICTPDYNAFLSQLSSPAPRLEYLRILMEGFPTESSSPSLLFNGDTPALRRLELLDCPVPWYSLKLTALTTLSLRHTPPQVQQSTPDFLATLRCMPNLQDLYLNNSLAPAAGFLSSTAFYSFQKINLPHLSRLLINGPISTVVALLSCVNIPLETQVSLGPDCFPDDTNISPVDAYTPLYSLLTQRYSITKDQTPTPSSLTIRSLGIQCIVEGQAILSFGTSGENSPVLAPYGEWRSNLPLQILLSLRQPTMSDDESLISRTCCCIPMSNVQGVVVSYPPTPSTFWTDILEHCPNLRYIDLRDGCMPNLVPPLSPIPRDRTENPDGPSDRGPSHMLVPALERLTFYNLSFSSGDMDPVEEADLQSLCDALSARKEPHGRLTIKGRRRISNRLVKDFNMEGCWGDGSFRRVYYDERYLDT